jgi:hypothetical protein
MQSNMYSIKETTGLDRLAAVVDELAAEDLAALPDSEAAQRVLVLRKLMDRLEGQWLRELAGVDGRGAAGADQGAQAESTAGWLRARLRAGRPQASRWVRTARALFRGPLAGTGQALAAGVISPAHATVLAAGTEDLPPATAAEAEPVLLEVASRVDPPGLRKVVTHLHEVADPDAAEAQAQRVAAPRGRADRAGPPQPGSRPAAADRRRTAPDHRHGRPAQLAGRRSAGWGRELAGAAAGRDGAAAGPRRHRDPRARHPTARW